MRRSVLFNWCERISPSITCVGKTESKMPKRQPAWFIMKHAEPASFHGSLPCCQGAIPSDVLKFRTVCVCVGVSPWTRMASQPFDVRGNLHREFRLKVNENMQVFLTTACENKQKIKALWPSCGCNAEQPGISRLFSTQYKQVHSRRNTALRRFNTNNALLHIPKLRFSTM